VGYTASASVGKCRLDTSALLGGTDYLTTGVSIKPCHCHDLQVVEQLKQKQGFSPSECLTKVNFVWFE